ncbi:MAG: ABC transporter ATP-binding protein [Parachlamydia sp.]|nr:ABC transporter ATP-binding protein [Parachlamydia sp.]
MKYMYKTILQAKKIYKSYRIPQQVNVLQGVDITILQGEAVAITGRSGQGKSTLLHVLGTLDRPCQGTLEIAGQAVTRMSVSSIRNRHIAFVFQSFHLLDDYTAIENILMPARIARESISRGSPAYRRGLELLDKVSLSDRAHQTTKLLSGGEKQRVAIARALCNHPDIIFADEPSGNLDRLTSRSIHDLLLNYVKEEGKTLVVVTHDLELASRCDRRFSLENGILSLPE